MNTIKSKLIDELQCDGFSCVVIACDGQGDPPGCAFGLPKSIGMGILRAIWLCPQPHAWNKCN